MPSPAPSPLRPEDHDALRDRAVAKLQALVRFVLDEGGALNGYLTVWAVCAIAALLAAGPMVVPRHAFSDRETVA